MIQDVQSPETHERRKSGLERTQHLPITSSKCVIKKHTEIRQVKLGLKEGISPISE